LGLQTTGKAARVQVRFCRFSRGGRLFEWNDGQQVQRTHACFLPTLIHTSTKLFLFKCIFSTSVKNYIPKINKALELYTSCFGRAFILVGQLIFTQKQITLDSKNNASVLKTTVEKDTLKLRNALSF